MAPSKKDVTQRGIEKYKKHAPGYDFSCRRTTEKRQRTVNLLNLKAGDRVLDVACGTGLSFPLLQAAVGPNGYIVGVEQSPDMMELAKQRVKDEGWENVTLILATMEDATLGTSVDAVLFNYTHDVLRSDKALKNIFSAVNSGATIAIAGMQRYSWWLAPLNIYVLIKANPYMMTFEGLYRPWNLVKNYVSDISITTIHLGTGYIASGTYTHPKP